MKIIQESAGSRRASGLPVENNRKQNQKRIMQMNEITPVINVILTNECSF